MHTCMLCVISPRTAGPGVNPSTSINPSTSVISPRTAGPGVNPSSTLIGIAHSDIIVPGYEENYIEIAFSPVQIDSSPVAIQYV